MSDIKEYKCPACGGTMEFDSKTQKMKCPFCYTELDVDDFEDEQDKQEAEQNPKQESHDATQWEAAGDGKWQEGETDGISVYSCKSCGGEIIADESTGATSCPFCGNQVVMKGKFAGDLKPDYIIPFKVDKKGAKAAYNKHLTGKSFLPKIFKQENHIDEIKGVYVPFWVFDADAEGNIFYRAEKVRTWRSGDVEYTERKDFQIERTGSIGFDHIPTDGSKKMDDVLMEAIEPFDFKGAVPFKKAYLAGYLADRYDVDMKERMNRAMQRIKKSVETSFRNSVQGYSMVNVTHSNVNVKNARYLYVLYPVWILNTTWHDKKYVFAMNGQTGKMVGDLPLDKKAFWKYVGTRGLILGVIVHIIRMLIALI